MKSWSSNNADKHSSIKFQFNAFEFNLKKEADQFCLINGTTQIMIKKLSISNGKRVVHGVKCLNVTPAFTIPISSANIGIIKYSNLSDVEEIFYAQNITLLSYAIQHQ